MGMTECGFKWRQKIGYKDHEPPKPKAHPGDRKHAEQATRVLKRWVCNNYHTWPFCPLFQKNVEIVFEFNCEPDLGHYLQAFFFCPECYAK